MKPNPKKKKRSLSLYKQTNSHMKNIMIVLLVCCALVICNVLYVMIAHTHLWSQINVLNSAVASSLVTTTLHGKRGTIYDRNYQVLAQETTAYTLVVYLDTRTDIEQLQEEADWQSYKKSVLASATGSDYETLSKSLEEQEEAQRLQYVSDASQTAKAIAKVLGDTVDESYLTSLIENAIKNNRTQTELGTGTKRLDKSVKEELEAAKIPGLGFVETTKRNYPSSPFSSNLLGFADYQEESGTIRGVTGLEATMESYLAGTDGKMQYQATMYGQVLPGTTKVLKEATNGLDVVLTLDSNLQQTVEEQMQITMDTNNASSAWCLVMEVETGKILAWASYPTYDQNTHLVIPSYTDNVSEMTYEPGSVMKPFVYATAIDTGVYPYNAVYRAGEFTYTVDSETGKITRLENGSVSDYPTIKDALGNDYGTLTFAEGLAMSSNVAICELLANYINQKNFEKYLSAFGFFKATDIPYVNESIGVKNTDDPTSYLSTGFGQASSVTVLQLAQAYTAIFNDGVMMQPYVVDSIVDSATGETIEKHEATVVGTPISSNTAAQVKEMMQTVLEEGRSGDRFAIDGVDMIAKTGTGEVYNSETGTYDTVNFTSSIMAAAPYDDPKIMVYWGMVSPNYINYSAEPFQTIMQAALIANSVSGSSAGSSSSTVTGYEKWESYEMPSLINHSVDYAGVQLEDKKVNTVIIGDGSSIIDQFPKSGTTINSNDNVILLTDGATLTMPDVIGWTRKDLTAFWQMTGLSIECDGYGKVTWQNIEPGTLLSSDAQIVVTLE